MCPLIFMMEALVHRIVIGGVPETINEEQGRRIVRQTMVMIRNLEE